MHDTAHPTIEATRLLRRPPRGAADDDRTRVFVPEVVSERALAPAPHSRAGDLARPVSGLVFSAVRRIAIQQSLEQAEFVLAGAAREFTASSRVYCYLIDPQRGTLYSPSQPIASPSSAPLAPIDLRSVDSVVTEVARSGRRVCLDRASDHPAFRADIDDRFGTGHEPMIAAPLAVAGQIVGVVTAVRRPGELPYSNHDQLVFAALLEHSAPVLCHFIVQRDRSRADIAQAQGGLFRGQALAHLSQRAQLGEVARTTPSYLSWCYWGLVGIALVALLASIVVPVNQYSSGVGVVHWEGTPVNTAYGGTVLSVSVQSGERVERGQVLAELFSVEEKAAYDELSDQFDAHLVSLLRDPNDQTSRAALRDIGAKRNHARARLDERRIRAPEAGVVADVRIQNGQNLQPGARVLSLVDGDVRPAVVAVLPGSDLPRIESGMSLLFRIDGYGGGAREAEIEWVSREVVGPHEASRYLGDEIADSLAIRGAVVLVKARLFESTFTDRDRELVIHHGMHGRADIKIGRSTLIARLIPGGD